MSVLVQMQLRNHADRQLESEALQGLSDIYCIYNINFGMSQVRENEISLPKCYSGTAQLRTLEGALAITRLWRRLLYSQEEVVEIPLSNFDLVSTSGRFTPTVFVEPVNCDCTKAICHVTANKPLVENRFLCGTVCEQVTDQRRSCARNFDNNLLKSVIAIKICPLFATLQ